MTAARPSLGIVFPALAPVESLPGFAGDAEAKGFAELWLVEDCFLSGGLTMAATALAATERIAVGIGLLPALMRNPALAAMEIATLARLHPGRIRIAFGHGVPAWMAQIGITPRRRLTALGEVVASVRALLRGETVTAVALDNPPDQVPPIVIGTIGPRGLRLAGGVGDGFLLNEGCGPEYVRWAIGEASAGRADGSPPPHRVAYAWARIDDDADAARAALEPSLRGWIEGGLYPAAYARAGVEDPAGPVDFAAVADAVAVHGDEAACVAAIERFADAGATSLVLVPAGEDLGAQIERLAAGVLPVFAEA